MQDWIRMLAAQGRLGLSAVRIVAAAILTHFGWAHVTGETGFFASNPFPLPDVLDQVFAFIALGGGFLLLLGLFSRYLGLLFTVLFAIVLYFAWVEEGLGFAGSQYPLLMEVCALLIATNGGGSISLDRALKRWDA